MNPTDTANAELSPYLRAIQHNTKALCDALRGVGIKTVTVEYSGSGDEGSIVETRMEPDNAIRLNKHLIDLLGIKNVRDASNARWVVEVSPFTCDVLDGVERLADDLIVYHHSGYEDGEGGGGEMVLDVETGKYKLAHYDNIITQDTSEHCG